MSDIGIIDGLAALVMAVALGFLLLIGIIVCAVFALTKTDQSKKSFIHQPIFPHLFGMLQGLLSCTIIVILIILDDQNLSPHLNIWLDQWIGLWGIGILMLWPLNVFIWKGWKEFKRSRS